jgi:hypothetical protein
LTDFTSRLVAPKRNCNEKFLKTEEAALVLEMQQYFAQAKGHAGGIRFDNASLWSKIENRVDVWFAEISTIEQSAWSLRFCY